MGRKKKKYNDYFASLNEQDKFGTLYAGMLTHDKFKALSIGAKYFYICCRVNLYKGRACLYKHGKEDGTEYAENDFAFPAAQQADYGIDRSNGAKYIKELEQAGFILRKEQNAHRRKVNVYSFSDKWKNTS